MASWLDSIKENLNSFWSKLERNQKRNIIIVFILILSFICISSYLMGKESYVVLYSGLDEKEKAEIFAKLKDLNIKARVPYGSSSIEVPSKKEAETRMQLAIDGYPKSGFNYDIYLKGNTFGQTDAEMQARWIFQLQERLSQSIRILEGVEDAVVNIAVPKTDSFVLKNQQVPVTASVIIVPKRGREISYENAQSIVQMVAKSIPGLDEDNVTIIDTDMNNLNSDYTSESMLVDNQFKLKYELEQKTNAQIINLLERVFGYKKVAVSSNIDLNFDKKIKESIIFEPVIDDSGIALSIEDLREKIQNGNLGGIPGETSNTTQYPEYINNENGTYEKNQKSINYAVNEIKEKIEEQQGSIEDLSISIIIDNERLDNQLLDSVKELVAKAIGTEPLRVAVQSMKFDTSFQDEIIEGLKERKPLAFEWLSTDKVLVFLAIMIFLAVIIFMVKMNMGTGSVKLSNEAVQEISSEVENIQQLNLDSGEQSQIKKQLDKLVIQKPDAVAQLLRNWLSED